MASYKQAVWEHCVSCIYDPATKGTKVQQVMLCNAYDCKLWKVRPMGVLNKVQFKDMPENTMKALGATPEEVEQLVKNPYKIPTNVKNSTQRHLNR